MFTKIPGLEFSVGMQSINPVALKNINRPTNIAKCREVILELAKNKIHAGIDLIMGLPGDNYESFTMTIDWTVYCRAQQVDINDLIILHNSDLERMAESFKIKCNNENMVLSNYSFSEEEMVKASHFKIGFQFLFGFYQRIFYMLVFECRFKPSEIVEKFIVEAEKRGEIPPGRLLDLSGINFSDQTVFCFLKSLFEDKQSVKYYFMLFRENFKRLKDNKNYRIEFMEISS
jgi:hypothetical protein